MVIKVAENVFREGIHTAVVSRLNHEDPWRTLAGAPPERVEYAPVGPNLFLPSSKNEAFS
jgi:hypothetical protein